MIITYNAAAATATYMYHLGEQHVMSQQPRQAFMLVWCTTMERLNNLNIYKQTNSFLRGFLQHQLQLEADCHWLFTDFERSTMASFKIITTDENTTFLNVFDRFGWQQGYVWCFNLLVNLNKVLRPNMTTGQCNTINYMIVQIFEYCGLELLQFLSATTKTGLMEHCRVNQIILGATPTKHPERIRGHPKLSTWLKSVQPKEVVEQHLIEINKYRMINMVQHQPAQEQQDDVSMERPMVRQRLV